MTNYQSQMDRVFHALADGNRRAMIDRLSRSTLTVSELREPLGISMPATMQHLAVLEDAGLVRSRKQGRVRTCELDCTALSEAEKWIQQRREFVGRQLDALGAFLASEDKQEDTDND